MHKLFNKKRAFLNNWQNLSQEQVLDNIKYLLENYKKYNISLLGKDRVRIDNILIYKKEIQILWYKYSVYMINKRMFTVNSQVGSYISKLIYCCEHAKDEQILKGKLGALKIKTLDLVHAINQKIREL